MKMFLLPAFCLFACVCLTCGAVSSQGHWRKKFNQLKKKKKSANVNFTCEEANLMWFHVKCFVSTRGNSHLYVEKKAILHLNVRNPAFLPLAGYLNTDQPAKNQLLIPFRPPAGCLWFFSEAYVVCWGHVAETNRLHPKFLLYLFLFFTYSCSLLIIWLQLISFI